MSLARVAAVIPAANESDRIAATVTAVSALPGVDIVIVDADLGESAAACGALLPPVQQARQLRDVTRALTARGLVQAGLKDFQDAGGVSQFTKDLLGRLRR